MNSFKERMAVARGERKADLVLKNGQLLNVFSGEIYPADVAIYKDRIVGLGSFAGQEEQDLNGRYILPGFIDGHLYVESAFLTLEELARAVVPHGTTTLVGDPHRLANVVGMTGLKYLFEAGTDLPLDVFFTLPLCVLPSELETSGTGISAQNFASLLKHKQVLPIGELLNFRAELAGNKKVLAKMDTIGQSRIFGSANNLTGQDLMAYVATGVVSDHEAATLAEAEERLRLGLQIFIKEGALGGNLTAILPLINPANARFFVLCSDDLAAVDLSQGHLNLVLAKAVAQKLDPVTAVQMVTLNPARFLGLSYYGAVAPGYYADINIVSDLSDFEVDLVFKRGQLVASRHKPLFEVKTHKAKGLRETIKVKSLETEDFVLPARSEYAKVIELIPGQLITKSIVGTVKAKKKIVVADTDNDILKLVVIERHKASGNLGVGLVKGFGLKRGALASSLAHDAHNIICVGVDDEDILSAVRRVVALGGGMTVVRGGLVLAEMALPIAGLLSDQPLAEVLNKQRKLVAAATELGCKLTEPFKQLSFLSYTALPELRLTDQGLVNVVKGQLVDLFES
ncbi:adenine deaminase [Candidatus Saganbacteria bacterium CG08_land_8_20_14_0_20_45_16]|uniref:Adenine deaminase n=1 Tax=Candidatus Saganbacteria bacterium CG08_land_8_20_14_0_20_45_16 TaxID=2014293 RepID=A0A2H0Y1A0_UNCSA|nr:MAG: adenine deaminase [Candidatus Saganbacteria bacterium CG08_land_8_20_14_0_20_45_16]